MQTHNKLLKYAFLLFPSLFSLDDKLGKFYSFASYKILSIIDNIFKLRLFYSILILRTLVKKLKRNIPL